ncbi:MAG: hypothetical protein H7Y37_18125 [Anaerolineae bacterium]|nr:hypothetical protein [Gloeobacterales cyanobacterium ES-bin-313]
MPLHAKDLLELVRQHSGKSVKQLAQLAGYTTTTKTGQKRVKVLAFQSAVLAAKKITFKVKEEETQRSLRGRKADYHIQVQQNGNLLIGATYTRQMGLLPCMEFEIQLRRKTIKLIQVESMSQLHDADVANLNDEELIQLTKSTFNPKEDDRLHELLDKKNTDHLQDEEFAELKILLEEYDKGMLQKSKALAEKHKRGLSQVATA